MFQDFQQNSYSTWCQSCLRVPFMLVNGAAAVAVERVERLEAVPVER